MDPQPLIEGIFVTLLKKLLTRGVMICQSWLLTLELPSYPESTFRRYILFFYVIQHILDTLFRKGMGQTRSQIHEGF